MKRAHPRTAHPDRSLGSALGGPRRRPADVSLGERLRWPARGRSPDTVIVLATPDDVRWTGRATEALRGSPAARWTIRARSAAVAAGDFGDHRWGISRVPTNAPAVVHRSRPGPVGDQGSPIPGPTKRRFASRPRSGHMVNEVLIPGVRDPQGRTLRARPAVVDRPPIVFESWTPEDYICQSQRGARATGPEEGPAPGRRKRSLLASLPRAGPREAPGPVSGASAPRTGSGRPRSECPSPASPRVRLEGRLR